MANFMFWIVFQFSYLFVKVEPVSLSINFCKLASTLESNNERHRDRDIEAELSRGKSYVIEGKDCSARTEVKFTVVKIVPQSDCRIFFIGQSLSSAVAKGNNIVQTWTLNTTVAPLVYPQNKPLVNLIIRVNDQETRMRFRVEGDQKTSFEGETSYGTPFSALILNPFKMWGDVANYTLTQLQTPIVAQSTYEVTAYIIVCAQLEKDVYRFRGCITDIYSKDSKNFVRCICRKGGNYIIAGILVTTLLVAALCMLCSLWKRRRARPQIGNEQILWVLCSPKSVQYQYDLCFRIGCPSENFEFAKTMIDFEFNTTDKRSMAQGRIKAHNLCPDEINEIHFIMNRLTVLSHNSFASISFKHNGGDPSSRIFFYEISITDCISAERYTFPVKKYIRSTTVEHVLGVEDSRKCEKPVPPLPKLTNSELILFFTFILYVNAALATNLVTGKYPETEYFIMESSGIAVASGFLVVALGICFRVIVKYQQIRHRLVLDKESTCWRLNSVIAYIILCTLSGVLLVLVAILGTNWTQFEIMIWFSAWFFITSITALFWALFLKLSLAEACLTCCVTPRVKREADTQKSSTMGSRSSDIKSSTSLSTHNSNTLPRARKSTDIPIDSETEKLVSKFAMEAESKAVGKKSVKN